MREVRGPASCCPRVACLARLRVPLYR